MNKVCAIIKNNKIYTSGVEKYKKGDEIKIQNIGILKGKFILFNSNNEEISKDDILKIKEQKLSPLWIFEFEEYAFESNEWELEKMGESKIDRDKNNENITLTKEPPFKNYVGKSEIALKNKNKNENLKIPVEVVSKKLIPKGSKDEIDFKSPLFYPKFCKNLIDGVWSLIASLPFNIETPVSVSSGFYTGKPHKIFTFFFLKNYREEIETSLNVIRANPYRILSEEKEFVNINRVSEIDNDTIDNILKYPEYLCECEEGFEANKRHYAPLKLLQPVKYETLDTPENRFVLYFVKLLLRDLEDLTKENIELGKIKDLKGFFEDFIKDPLWEEVGELLIFPSTSTVLRMRDGYRELYSLYLKYLFSRKPFEKIQEAIDLRKVYELYEFWCALKLCEILNILNKEKNKINITPDDKIPESFKMDFEFSVENKGYKFIYQSSKKSYSGLYLRPDFSIYKYREEEAVLLLDAKFAFDTKSITGEEDEMEKAEKENRFPKTGNIIKMHAYKDALKANACVVLYPGDESKFYKEENGEDSKDEKIIFEILKNDLKGIGWIPFFPTDNQEEK